MALTAEARALPPVAQPFLTLVKGMPVNPRSLTRVSASPDPSLPPKAASTSAHPSPASSNAARMAWSAISRPDTPGCRPNLDNPAPTIATGLGEALIVHRRPWPWRTEAPG